MSINHLFIFSAAFALTACTLHQQDDELRAEPVPLFGGGQEWQIVNKGMNPAGRRVCTLSAGEVQVTHFADARGAGVQVGTSRKMSAGNHYKILVGEHVYRTSDSLFTPTQSRAIVADMVEQPVFYTEMQEPTVDRGRSFQNATNKIGTGGFSGLNQACARFVAGQ